MKRFLAYFNLSIFLLAVLGYYGILSGMKAHSGKRLTKKLETEMYDLGGNITVKVPFSLPFEVTSEYYEREDGEFEMDGETFRIIKQRHYNDTLYIVCIRDEQTTRIKSAIHDLVQTFAGQDDGEGKEIAPISSKDYIREDIVLTKLVTGWEKDIQLFAHPQFLFDAYSASIIQPPEGSIG